MILPLCTMMRLYILLSYNPSLTSIPFSLSVTTAYPCLSLLPSTPCFHYHNFTALGLAVLPSLILIIIYFHLENSIFPPPTHRALSRHAAPRFGVEEFFFFLMVLMSLSFLALALLDHWSLALKERVPSSSSTVPTSAGIRDRRQSARRRRRNGEDDDDNESGSEVSGQMSASSSVVSEKPIWQSASSNQNIQQLTLPSTGEMRGKSVRDAHSC